ncbi:hypothetical protein E2C01_016600 [Portunus trituberculatus]|uniref:Uncharacterized protein n=1 Tax=Portunus trituberculatus TaxID=210409 RepID=A0A5B7DRJ4_PORTR|nr:hypothetical protein [Portunus trituberculatus]
MTATAAYTPLLQPVQYSRRTFSVAPSVTETVAKAGEVCPECVQILTQSQTIGRGVPPDLSTKSISFSAFPQRIAPVHTFPYTAGEPTELISLSSFITLPHSPLTLTIHTPTHSPATS